MKVAVALHPPSFGIVSLFKLSHPSGCEVSDILLWFWDD